MYAHTPCKEDIMETEDFTTFTVVDAGDSGIVGTTTSTEISACLHNDAGDFYVYKDKGSDYYSEDFTFRFQLQIPTTGNTHHGVYPQDNGRNQFWALSNTLSDLQSLIDASGDELCLQVYPGESPTYSTLFTLKEVYSGATYQDSSTTLTTDINYYVTIIRDESVGSFGSLTLYICTGNYYDESGSSTVDTLSVTLHGKVNFQYLYALQNWNRTSGFWNYYVFGELSTLAYTLSTSVANPHSFAYIID